MISLKEWNSFSSDTREAILKTVDCCSLYTFNKEYHHNFDFDAIGKRLKQYLDSAISNQTIPLKCVLQLLLFMLQRK